MPLATKLIVETSRKSVTLRLDHPMSIWEVRDYCRELSQGGSPPMVTIAGNEARATYLPTPSLDRTLDVLGTVLEGLL